MHDVLLWVFLCHKGCIDYLFHHLCYWCCICLVISLIHSHPLEHFVLCLSSPLLSSPRPLPILVPVSGLVVTLDGVWGGRARTRSHHLQRWSNSTIFLEKCPVYIMWSFVISTVYMCVCCGYCGEKNIIKIKIIYILFIYKSSLVICFLESWTCALIINISTTAPHGMSEQWTAQVAMATQHHPSIKPVSWQI